ncbi:hypothetical protein [Streptomyces cinnamoneus]|uniref:Uncharacterized protein n=1 Tax=Streptomyces cinnamoneus TaxID=53446 RepID=A0A918WJ79_STRCJ|nr:hypothetical protein [Streptomyces cinnamoneus]GHC51452.1 hypothetical protein GCM10010507_29230 [Streptomyces cinnamoneus]
MADIPACTATAADEALVQETAELAVALVTREGALTRKQNSELAEVEEHGGSHSWMGAAMWVSDWAKALQAALAGDDGSEESRQRVAEAKDLALQEMKGRLRFAVTGWSDAHARDAMHRFIADHGPRAR